MLSAWSLDQGSCESGAKLVAGVKRTAHGDAGNPTNQTGMKVRDEEFCPSWPSSHTTIEQALATSTI